jgi:predicted membrane protein
MSEHASQSDQMSARDVIAGLLAGASVVLSAIGAGLGLILEVDGHPGKTIPVAALLAIVSGVMSARFYPMALKALAFASICWVVGMTIAVLTDAPLF